MQKRKRIQPLQLFLITFSLLKKIIQTADAFVFVYNTSLQSSYQLFQEVEAKINASQKQRKPRKELKGRDWTENAAILILFHNPSKIEASKLGEGETEQKLETNNSLREAEDQKINQIEQSNLVYKQLLSQTKANLVLDANSKTEIEFAFHSLFHSLLFLAPVSTQKKIGNFTIVISILPLPSLLSFLISFFF